MADQSEIPSTQEESQNEETTTTTTDTTTTEETPAPVAADAAAGDADLLTKELDGLEEMVVGKLKSDETKSTIESAVINPVVSLAQGLAQSAKGYASKVEAKFDTLASNPAWSSLLPKKQQQPNDGSLPTSDEQAPRSTDENQPLVGSEAKASWMNCCGILEAFVKPSDK